MPDFKEVLANSYCDIFIDYFKTNEAGLNEELDKIAAKKQEDSFVRLLNQYTVQRQIIIEQWSNMPLEALQGSTPLQVLQSMENLDEVFTLFLFMAQHVDEEVPYIIVDKLKEFGHEAVSRLINLAEESTDGGEQQVNEFFAAVSALGSMKLEECIAPLIELAFRVQHQDPKLEHVQDALKNMGEGVIEPILNRLDNAEYGNAELTLMYVLAFVAKEAKEDRIYQVFRNAFREMEDKLPAILCLSVYGDGRAVPMMRSYLEKNANHIPKNIFYEIAGAIQSLGGDTKEFANLKQ